MIDTENGAVLQRTIELCETIVNDPGFSALRKNLDAFTEDAGVQAQYQELSEAGAQLQRKQQMGMPLEDAEIRAFEAKRETFLSSPVAQGYVDAQQAVQKVRDTVSRYVARTFEL